MGAPGSAPPRAAGPADFGGAVVGGLLSRWTDGGAGVLVAAAAIALIALPLPAERRRA